MSLLKRCKSCFCKHEYKLYGCTEKPLALFVGIQNVYSFICPKCEHEISVDSLVLKDELKKEKLKIQKQIILGKEIYLNNETFRMKTSIYDLIEQYEGQYVDAVKQKYLKKGINLNEISELYS